ncbi:MAG: NAD(P)-dependent oxidoreductase, partial [Gemmatimonadetes bacterium]|nr:NAD(P)-dependent oxidoreductase [Gemmatimonadota bacterium]
MTRTVLVTGGAGSMGRLVTERLLAQGAAVRVFDLPSVSFDALEGREGVEVVRGDLTDGAVVAAATRGVDAVVHLAAILPPLSERDVELTRRVNVEGTALLLRAVERASPDARFVFSSSVSVYGDTSADAGPVTTRHGLAPDDAYALSKAEAEEIVARSPLKSVVLRVSGVVAPVFQEPPAEWPFRPDGRIEFIHREDAVSALVAAVSVDVEPGVLNVAGGPSWRVRGETFVRDLFERL